MGHTLPPVSAGRAHGSMFEDLLGPQSGLQALKRASWASEAPDPELQRLANTVAAPRRPAKGTVGGLAQQQNEAIERLFEFEFGEELEDDLNPTAPSSFGSLHRPPTLGSYHRLPTLAEREGRFNEDIVLLLSLLDTKGEGGRPSQLPALERRASVGNKLDRGRGRDKKPIDVDRIEARLAQNPHWRLQITAKINHLRENPEKLRDFANVVAQMRALRLHRKNPTARDFVERNRNVTAVVQAYKARWGRRRGRSPSHLPSGPLAHTP
eukprot:EG_transcript_15064